MHNVVLALHLEHWSELMVHFCVSRRDVSEKGNVLMKFMTAIQQIVCAEDQLLIEDLMKVAPVSRMEGHAFMKALTALVRSDLSFSDTELGPAFH